MRHQNVSELQKTHVKCMVSSISIMIKKWGSLDNQKPLKIDRCDYAAFVVIGCTYCGLSSWQPVVPPVKTKLASVFINHLCSAFVENATVVKSHKHMRQKSLEIIHIFTQWPQEVWFWFRICDFKTNVFHILSISWNTLRGMPPNLVDDIILKYISNISVQCIANQSNCSNLHPCKWKSY